MTMDMNNQTAQAGQDGGQMQEIMQAVQQMLEQGAQPVDVVTTLINDYQLAPEAILELLVQMGMPQDQAQQTIEAAMQGASQPQGSGEEQMEGSESSSEEEMTEQPEMMFGGPVKKDFQKLAQDMIKQYRKGGESDGLDESNTQSYIENLKGAIANHIAKSNAIATVKKRSQSNMALFDGLPTAENGKEITDDQLKEIQKVDPTMTKEKFLGYDADIQKAWLEPKTTPTSTGGKNYRFENGKFIEVPSNSNNITEGGNQKTADQSSNVTDDYNGVQANPNRSFSGRTLNTQQFLTSPLGQMLSAVGEKKPTGNVQVKGFGSLAGADQNELSKMLASGNYGVSAIEDVRRKGIFGREKRNDTDIFGRSNVIGKRVYFGPTGSGENTGTSTPSSLSGSATNPTGFDSKGRNIEEYLQEMKISKADYDNNVGGVKDAVNKEFGIVTPTVHPNAGDITTPSGDDYWSKKQAREFSPITDERKVSTPSTGYMPEYGDYLDRNEKEINDFATQLGVSPEELKDPAIMNAVLDAMEGGTGKFYMSPNSPMKKMGGPVWDWKTMKFVNGGTIPLAKDGMETYINVIPEYEREIDFASLAQGIYGAGDALNQKLDAFRNRTPRNIATAERSTDNMFDPAAPDSGQKGFYDEMGRFIPIDMGARVLPGTGTDQSVYGQFTNKNFYDDFITNNVRKKNGGLVRASKGIELGAEIDLNDDDLAAFESLGYKVKRIG
jgi:hypothetical protein